jgi:hypothetical protein
VRLVRWLSGATVAVLVATTGSACRPELPQPAGIGDIAFRLQWEGTADLDLLVVEPSGQRIWFGERRSATGGFLDVDCNFVTVCDHPIENVYWAKGTAPAGTYHYQVALANAHGATLPIPFTVSVLHGRRVVTTERGAIVRRGDVWGPMLATWKNNPGSFSSLDGAEK